MSDEDRSAFDAVLMVSFGGPGGRDDIRPFLANVLRGRLIPPERVEEVAHHYELFDGVSPLTDITMRQAKALEQRLREAGHALPVFVGMRNWHPFLADVLAEMSRAGVSRAVGLIAAAHHCYSSCGQYKENVRDARRDAVERGTSDIEVHYVDSWFEHPGFIEANAAHVRDALHRLDPAVRDRARVIFTAHSIPLPMAERSQYEQQLRTSARLVAERLGRGDWALVYQSRSGRPQDPWLEPDICEYLRAERQRGLDAAVICAIGFLCDHVEVLYDLDHEAAGVCGELGLPLARAETVNDDPRFIDALTDAVLQQINRHRRFPPLPIAPAEPAP